MRTLVMKSDKIVGFGVVSTSELTFRMKIKKKLRKRIKIVHVLFW
jgi:hypothetical protein